MEGFTNASANSLLLSFYAGASSSIKGVKRGTPESSPSHRFQTGGRAAKKVRHPRSSMKAQKHDFVLRQTRLESEAPNPTRPDRDFLYPEKGLIFYSRGLRL